MLLIIILDLIILQQTWYFFVSLSDSSVWIASMNLKIKHKTWSMASTWCVCSVYPSPSSGRKTGTVDQFCLAKQKKVFICLASLAKSHKASHVIILISNLYLKFGKDDDDDDNEDGEEEEWRRRHRARVPAASAATFPTYRPCPGNQHPKFTTWDLFSPFCCRIGITHFLI